MVQDNWWHIILLTPFAVPIVGLIGSPGVILTMWFVVSYPIAMYKDSKYLNQSLSEWNPNPLIYAGIGFLVMLTIGLLSYIISPIYLYKRYKYT